MDPDPLVSQRYGSPTLVDRISTNLRGDFFHNMQFSRSNSQRCRILVKEKLFCACMGTVTACVQYGTVVQMIINLAVILTGTSGFVYCRYVPIVSFVYFFFINTLTMLKIKFSSFQPHVSQLLGNVQETLRTKQHFSHRIRNVY